MSISIKNLNYVYDSDSPFFVAALNNVDVEIEDGQFVSIIGHTGSGKSTLVQHFNGILKPTSAEKMEIEGINLMDKKPDYKLLRQKVGMVFQYPEYQLFEETVFEDIAFGPKNMGFSEEEISERVTESMALVKLPESVKNLSPFELSGGQKRRAAIAGVLSMRPKVLVLDEPIAGLDPLGKAEILQVIKDYREKYNATIIMISHNMDDIAEISDRVIVMHKGEKALDGTPDEVFSSEEKILSLGLELPIIPKLIFELNRRGKNIPFTAKCEKFVENLTGVKK